eukprot:2980594-Karenia_brevis.AAC.1
MAALQTPVYVLRLRETLISGTFHGSQLLVLALIIIDNEDLYGISVYASDVGERSKASRCSQPLFQVSAPAVKWYSPKLGYLMARQSTVSTLADKYHPVAIQSSLPVTVTATPYFDSQRCYPVAKHPPVFVITTTRTPDPSCDRWYPVVKLL